MGLRNEVDRIGTTYFTIDKDRYRIVGLGLRIRLRSRFRILRLYFLTPTRIKGELAQYSGDVGVAA